MGVQVQGLRELVRNLEHAGSEVSDLKAAFKPIAQDVVDEAKPLVHNVTDRLSRSIRPGTAKNKAIVRAGSAKVVYARVVNYRPGTRSTGYLTSPANSNLDKRVTRLIDALNDLFESLNLAR